MQAADEALIVPLTAGGEVLLSIEPSAAFDMYAGLVERCDLPRARAWQRRTARVDLPDDLAASLQLAYQALVARTGSPAVVVRSSFHAEDRAGVEQQIREHLADGTLRHRMEYRMLSAGGAYRFR